MYPEGLFYSEEHEWIKKESDSIVIIGITQYAQDKLGEVVYVELPETGVEIEKDDTVAEIESVKSVSPIYSPLSGKIVDINEKLEDKPDLINSSPYDEGWIYKLHISDESEMENLLSKTDYQNHIEKLS